MKLRLLLGSILFALLPLSAHAEIVAEEIKYTVDKVEYTGYLAYDNSKGARPGVLLVHEWWGLNDYARTRAYMLAKAGYTAFAVDMYGSGKVADHPDNAKAFMMQVFNDLPGAEKRFDAAYSFLNQHKATQKDHIAAMGYCFGGAIVLHMARIGKPLEAVVSFHGTLVSNLPADKPAAIKGKVMAFTGGADAMIPAEQVTAFTQEMFNNHAEFAVQVYPDAKHSFTNPNADNLGEKFSMPLAYNQAADSDSWAKTLQLFARTFPQ
jgi:dienelactone hydrolase